MKVSGWGRNIVVDCHASAPRDEASLVEEIKLKRVIARGNGRSYGDSAISTVNTISMRFFNHFLEFDDSGLLVAEAGVSIEDIIDVFLPRGWFPPVTPGTKFVTLGGIVASDVHGKNHHKHGSLGNFVEWIDLVTGSGDVIRCSPSENAEVFAWTIGGMGLTGVILRVALRLMPVESSWMTQRTIACSSLDDVLEEFQKSESYTYSVAWIDCLSTGSRLGRSLLMLGEHAAADDLKKLDTDPFTLQKKRRLRMLFNAPRWLLNSFFVRTFNKLYYLLGQLGRSEKVVYFDQFFYPLDSVLEWNRLYGKDGFLQFQCVFPLETSYDGLSELLKLISDSGQGSFLAVLKLFGEQTSRFSFPMEGYTLALDFANSPANLALIGKLEDVTVKYKGRFYLAKDSHLAADKFKASDARVAEFIAMRDQTINKEYFSSHQSERLGI